MRGKKPKERQRYVLRVNETLVEVTRDVYLAWYQSRRKERYQLEKMQKNGVCGIEKVEETSYNSYLHILSPEEIVIRVSEIQELQEALKYLSEEEMELIKTMRPGLIQLEIGVQSTNLDTIREIHRTMKFEQVAEVVRRINSYGNVHQHLDLIAGLPYEDYESFGKSFDDVYALEPEQLQLGFLKVLKGSYMEEKKDDYGLVYKGMPPYEVLYTKWLPYEDTLRLKGIEEMVETYYNSRQFCYTLPYLIRHFKRPFTLFEKLAEYYEENGLDTLSHARTARYEILYDFARFYDAERCEAYKQLLTLDFYLRENAKSRPLFAGDERISKEEFRLFYDREDEERRYLENYENMEKRQLRKMTHIERFSYDVLGDMKEEECVLLFDYQNRNPLDHQAKVFCVTEEIRELCKQ